MSGRIFGTGCLRLRKYWLHFAVLTVGIGCYAQSVARQWRAVDAVLVASGQVTYDLGQGADGDLPGLRTPIAVRRGESHVWLDFYKTPTDVQLIACSQGDSLCKSLAQLPELRFVKIQDSRLTDRGLAQLSQLRKLQALTLSGTDITDSGIRHLTGMPDLWQLMLARTRITDRGLARLRGLNKLRWLDVERTLVTTAGVNSLQRAVPSCGTVVRSEVNGGLPQLAGETSAGQVDATDLRAAANIKPLADQSRMRINSGLAFEEL